jgi:hypothetical protein
MQCSGRESNPDGALKFPRKAGRNRAYGPRTGGMPMKRLDCKPEVWGYGGRRGVIVGACLVAGVAAAVFAFGEVSHLVSSRRRLGTGSASRPTKGMCRSTGSAQGMDSHSGPVLGAGGSSGSAQGLSRPSDRVHGATSSAVGSAPEGCVGSDQIVIVLGYRNPGERVNGINRFRVRAALRTLDPEARSAVIIFCGGAVASAVPEAELLADYAREELGYTGRRCWRRAANRHGRTSPTR